MFIPEMRYVRRNIHNEYGGNWQSGICPSNKFPYIFIFSGASGKQHGYKDEWVNEDVFTYTGEGQSGDMQFTRGNLALREHLNNGKRVFLFESEKNGFVVFKAEVEFYDADYFETPDTSGALRQGIKFFFKRVGATIKVSREQLSQGIMMEPFQAYMVAMPESTERISQIKTRVGQGAYRKSIMHRWHYQCGVTGFDDPRILIASHIVPWKDASTDERLDVDNGILLSPTYDALFDKHFISFENNGKIILSEEIDFQAFQKIGISGKEKLNQIHLGNQAYLERHRGLVYL
jgi:5-methylcytosine-specific restriction protein A